MLSFSSTGYRFRTERAIYFNKKRIANKSQARVSFPGPGLFGRRKAVGAFVLCLASALLLHIVFCFISARRSLLHEHLAARAVGVALDYNLSALRPCNALAFEVVDYLLRTYLCVYCA